jgi:RNA polymerase primary sigma factor
MVQRNAENLDRDEIVRRMLEILTNEPGQDATRLGAQLGLHKSVVNPILYNDSLFARSGDAKPQWYLAEHADQIAVSVPVPATADGESVAVKEKYDDPYAEDKIDLEALARFRKVATVPRVPYIAPSPDKQNPLDLYEWQREALESWHLYRDRGVIDAVTGAGKTLLAIAAILEQVHGGGKTVVVVPTIALLHQWADVLSVSIPEARLGLVGDGHDDLLEHHDILVAVIASARNRAFKLAGASGLLVVDECHRSASEKNQEALDARFEKRLGLSATHERMDNAHETVLLPYFRRVAYTLNYRRAIDDGVITNVRVAFVGVDFSEEEMVKFRQITRELITLRRKLIKDHGCRAQPFSAFLDDVVRLASGGGKMREGIVANRWLTLWREKRELLAETPAKQAALSSMTGAMSDASRTLLFTQSILSADTIRDTLTERGVAIEVHHSGISSDDRERTMADFEDGKVRVLASVQTLEEGIDVPDADLAVIVAASKQRRQMIQRMGRVMRRKADGRDARFIILYVKNTDEDPRFGAHELFVEELLDVAREINLFELESDDDLRSFLDPRRT